MKRCTIIGISDSREQWFAPDVLKAIEAGRVFSGGKRHHEIMESYLSGDAQWIDITIPLSSVFAEYEKHDEVVVFASGDPLFYGFAATVQRECPDCQLTIFPSFNSLQMLAHRIQMPYQDMHVVSLTGRPWHRFDEALINGEALLGVLTDRNHTPRAIAQRMLDYGYDNYSMIVGENLGNSETERIITIDDLRNEEVPEFAVPNCIILRRIVQRQKYFGIPDEEFTLLDGRAKMITKKPIRLLSLSMLDLRNRRSLWDVGFCTGSVSIEAKLQFPHLQVTSFEVREEGRQLIQENTRRFGTPGIEALIGDFLIADLSDLPRPDAIFIGGHGGRLREMVARLHEVMLPGACIVFNSVSESSQQMFAEAIVAVGMQITQTVRIAVDEHNPILCMKAERPNSQNYKSPNFQND